MTKKFRQNWLAGFAMLGLALVAAPVFSQSISGEIANQSSWRDGLPGPPGNGDGLGAMVVQIQTPTSSVLASNVLASGAMPFAYGPFPFSFGGAFADGIYNVVAWLDGDSNGERDQGEPYGVMTVTIAASNSINNVSVNIREDYDKDGLPDWWEWHWFRGSEDPMGFGGGDDPDGDGLTNLEEYRMSSGGYGFDALNPANWDTDGDGMDDGWECRYYARDVLMGMNPLSNDAIQDFDGDGLSNWQEYCGVDGEPRMIFDMFVNGVRKGIVNSADDLNPLDVDTDYDMLVDSYEAAWYDPVNRIDPKAGVMATMPTDSMLVDTSLAREDSDQDGMSNYREQSLLMEFRQASTNGWMWNWRDRVPFAFYPYKDIKGESHRICRFVDQGGANLPLGLVPALTIPTTINRFRLRNQEWTDPTEGTGYPYVDEDIPPGHDTDEDGLPDGWEVQFGLDPQNDGFGGTWDNGPFGDPDGDGLMNIEEYKGQDENRSVTQKYINGTGDETNPNQYNWRPDSTYSWRWYDESEPASGMGDPRTGTGISRDETLGSALPTTSLGQDSGTDSDDDGIPDGEEIYPTTSFLPSSPVDSCDPYISRAALITSASGIPISDPESATSNRFHLAGFREDLQRRDWTLECQVKLLGTNLSGALFNFQTVYGPSGCIVYRLSLSNNVPILTMDQSASKHAVITAKALPTNQWVHLAGVWDHSNNYLSLYIDGVLEMSLQLLGENMSSKYMFPATNQMALATSADGSFVNRLMLDEVRIWGLARTAQQISDYSRKLVPPVNGDDVWIQSGDFSSVIVHGGGVFGREPGIPLAEVYSKDGSYWIDDGDGKYDEPKDLLLKLGTNLYAGATGILVPNVFWNDKDNSGAFTRNALLAYYRFDDGGCSAEDFARRAKNGLMGATCEEFRFGDRGYALSTNYFSWVTTDPAPVYGVDKRGADDSDHDGLPDAWEIIHGLDPWDDGTWQETSSGVKDGPNGAKGDPDHDGLINIYEYWSGTNPRAEVSDLGGTLDSQQDRDGDGVVNITEQLLGSRPDIIDTDDDEIADNEEQAMGTSPVNPVDPAISRAVVFGGSAGDFLEIPVNIKQRLTSWTVEAWVNPTNTVDGAGILMRRVVENLAGGTQAVNYVVGLETNGAGLRAYAGYVLPTGKRYIVSGGVISAGVWTHIAATFDETSAIQSLYTNGVRVGSITNLFEKPPVNGRGGQTFVRIGENFGGMLDEIRLWSTVRTESNIRANTNGVISAADMTGMVHYFRFDDGQAITNNNFPSWNEFHQPAGFQDFTYERDWSEQWRHAAISHGNLQTVIPGAIVPPPSLRIILQPEDAVLAGAQWWVDGRGWQESSASVQGLAPGPHTITYKPITGWTEPSGETVVLSNGVATTFMRQYVQQASVVVWFNNLTTPPGAGWRVNGGVWMQSGIVASNVVAGTNVLSYAKVAGWFEPPIESVVMDPGTTTELLRNYTVMTSAVTVIIIPTNAATGGAQWRVDSGVWRNSAEQAGGLSLSEHVVEFSPLSRWIAPANISFTPTNEVPIVVTGRYAQITGLAVDIVPASAVATGAQWRVSGGVWTNSGVLLPMSPGTYTVQFKAVGGNWLSSGDRTVMVVDEQVTELVGTYFQATIIGGNISTNLGDFWQPRGVTLDAMHRLYVADTFNDRIQMFDPVSQAWSLVAPKGSATGQFMKPFGLTTDALGNLYVADQINSRIQKRIASNSVWVVLGSNSLGSAIGQFRYPVDVAVDSALNLYVADFMNDRVQRLSSSGVWSVFVTNGMTAGRVIRPQGVMVDGTGAVYVSDLGSDSNSMNRIQKFSSSGAYLGLVGDNQAATGGLNSPAGMTMGGGSLYLADVLNNRVAVTPTNGSSWATLVGGTALSGPEDVAWDPRGFLFIADSLNNRILMIPILPGAETNGVTPVTTLMSIGTNTSFTISWFGRLNWNYAVQYADTLMTPWYTLAGGSNIVGLDVMTNYTDTTILGVSNRFYRVIGY
jgi:hypothetical protein